jgi:uncharacterized protein (DUF1697 family)
MTREEFPPLLRGDRGDLFGGLMFIYISLLRGINVSGQKQIRMAKLKDLYESLKLTNMTTYVQSGNVVFGCREKDAAKVAASLETAIAQAFGYAVSVILRDRNELIRVRESNPFVNERHEDPAKLHVTFLLESPAKSALSKLPVSPVGGDEFHVSGQEIYLFCPDGYGRTKLSNAFFEKKLGVTATTRNWKTVNALWEIAER